MMKYLNFDTALYEISIVPPLLLRIRAGIELPEIRIQIRVEVHHSAVLVHEAAALLFQLFLAVTFALVISGKQDPAPHDVPLVASRPEGAAHPAADKHFAVVGVVGNGALVPAGMSVFGIVLAGKPDGNVTIRPGVYNLQK